MRPFLSLTDLLRYFFVLVWIVNGLFCKVLNFVPRHQLIVERILGSEYGFVLTKMIGVSEILMTIWILSGIRQRLCLFMQIGVVGLMNIIEFSLAPDLLLFGKLNLLFAGCFMMLVYFQISLLPSDPI